LKPKYDYTKKQNAEDRAETAMVAIIATALISLFIAWLAWPEDRYDVGYAAAKSEYGNRYREGYEAATASYEKWAAANGKAEFYLDKFSGKVKFRWK
jgi:hypothetical protein